MSTVEAIALKGASLLLSFSILDLCNADQLVPIWQFDGVPLWVLKLHDACLRVLSFLPEASSAAQVHRDRCVVEASGCIRRIISLKVVLVIPLLPLLWDESSHLIIVSSPEDLINGFLRYNAVDSSFL